jgi:hypothetical protein
MADDPDRTPTVAQIRELTEAVGRFAWADDRSSYPGQWWRQEDDRLQPFVRLAEALRPLRGLGAPRGWPPWVPLADLIRETAAAFDAIAAAWGWLEVLEPGPERAAYIRRRHEEFAERYLTPIRREAAKCLKHFTAVDRPAALCRIASAVPGVGVGYWDRRFIGDLRFAVLRVALLRKDTAPRIGSAFPTLSADDGVPAEDRPAVAQARTLRAAWGRLKAAVSEADLEGKGRAAGPPARGPRGS